MEPQGPAAGIHVLVEPESLQLTAARNELRGQSNALLPILIPVMLVAIVVGVVTVAKDADGNATVAVVGTLLALVPIALITWLLLRRQRRRAERYLGRIWSSGAASYAGPHDDTGLEGSARFAARHRDRNLVPIVRLILTNTALVIMPSFGRRETLNCPLGILATLEIESHGMTLLTRTGRRAEFIFKPDKELVPALETLGAIVTRGPTV